MNENKKNNKLIANIIFFIIVIILLGIVVFNLNDINDIIKHAKNMKASFLVLAVLLVICHMFLTDLSLYVLQKNPFLLQLISQTLNICLMRLPLLLQGDSLFKLII